MAKQQCKIGERKRGLPVELQEERATTMSSSGTPPLPPQHQQHPHHPPNRSLLPRASSMPLDAGAEWAERAAREGAMDMMTMSRSRAHDDVDGGREGMGVRYGHASEHTPPHASSASDDAAARAAEAVRAAPQPSP